MSYVAEPYLYITDQVLTGLTGGVARESHRFFPKANSFRFLAEQGDPVPETVQIIGQAQDAFYAFQQGKDYAVAGDGTFQFLADAAQPTTPAAKATWPDEGSEFFVNYYHTESGKAALTDRNVGSLVRTLAESFARELAVLRKQLELIYDSGFVDTAAGTALDRVVALVGLARRGGDTAIGVVRFFRDTPAPADISIPEGARVSTALNPPASFVTTAAKTLRRGQLAVDAPIRAEAKGAAGLAAERTIGVINQPILGISGVVNEVATVLGGAAESDAELRTRAKRVIERIGKSTPRALLHALTTEAGLGENEIKIVEELALRPGVVQVFVAREASAELAVKVQNAILNSRAAGIRVEHNLAIALPMAPKDALPTGPARDDGITDQLPSSADCKLPLVCDLTVFPENPRISGGDKATLQQSVSAVVTDYVQASAIGGTLVYNQLVASLMGVAGVLDVVLDLKPKGIQAGKCNVQLPDGRRATLDAQDLTVRFAGAPVSFDFVFLVTLKPGGDKGGAETDIKKALVTLFAGAPAKVSSAALLALLGASNHFSIQEADVSWTAEYDQAGLMVRDQGGPGAETAIAAGDRAVLRNVKVEVKP
ncbi:MAG: baseplate J/gp47 family protein [Acidobacteria bacterium]|nr:baseplate J/gp47 family protein [Acidobacteriota bacterium]